MKKIILSLLLAPLMAASLGAAAKASIEVRNGPPLVAYQVDSETLAGVAWLIERGKPGTRVDIWNLVHVGYDGQFFQEYNSMARRVSPAQGQRLQKDAQSYIDGKPSTLMNDIEWQRVLLACRYYVAFGLALQGKHQEAADKYIEYLKAAEEKPLDAGLAVPYRSPISQKDIPKAGGLHRLYLNALENLGHCYMELGDAQKANDMGFKPLLDLGSAMAARTTSTEYYEWPLRGLKTMAARAEVAKDYKAARAAYETVENTARAKDRGQPSRVSYEASLKVGYMMVMDGDVAGARSRFFSAVSQWERSAHGDEQLANPQAPRANWISPDLAYYTAGSYVGQGLIEAARAKTSTEWAAALKNFSTALAVFKSDDEVRSMALHGAAQAASMIAEANAGKPDVANSFARLSEKYLTELTTQLPKSLAAQSESVPEIEKRVAKYKK